MPAPYLVNNLLVPQLKEVINCRKQYWWLCLCSLSL